MPKGDEGKKIKQKGKDELSVSASGESLDKSDPQGVEEDGDQTGYKDYLRQFFRSDLERPDRRDDKLLYHKIIQEIEKDPKPRRAIDLDLGQGSDVPGLHSGFDINAALAEVNRRMAAVGSENIVPPKKGMENLKPPAEERGLTVDADTAFGTKDDFILDYLREKIARRRKEQE